MTLTHDLQHELDRAQLNYDLIEHRRTETAGEEARAIGVPPEQVAKTIVLASDEGYVRAVLPASQHLNLHKVRQLLGNKHARLASEAELVLAYPMYELGAVPPFGGRRGGAEFACEPCVLVAEPLRTLSKLRCWDAGRTART